jgi:hypothetical protein
MNRRAMEAPFAWVVNRAKGNERRLPKDVTRTLATKIGPITKEMNEICLAVLDLYLRKAVSLKWRNWHPS